MTAIASSTTASFEEPLAPRGPSTHELEPFLGADRQSAAIIDSQSVKTTESGGVRDYDAGTKIKGHKRHVLAFVSAYNFAKHLKALRWKIPFEAVCHAWTVTPEIFKLNLGLLIPGPNT